MPRQYVNPDGSKVAELRNERDLTQEEFAKRLGYAKRTIERIESGKNTRLSTLQDIATALDVPVQELTNRRIEAKSQMDPNRLVEIGIDRDQFSPRELELLEKVNTAFGTVRVVDRRGGSIVLTIEVTSREIARRLVSEFDEGRFAAFRIIAACQVDWFDLYEEWSTRVYAEVPKRIERRFRIRFGRLPNLDVAQETLQRVLFEALYGRLIVKHIDSFERYVALIVRRSVAILSQAEHHKWDPLDFDPAARDAPIPKQAAHAENLLNLESCVDQLPLLDRTVALALLAAIPSWTLMRRRRPPAQASYYVHASFPDVLALYDVMRKVDPERYRPADKSTRSEIRMAVYQAVNHSLSELWLIAKHEGLDPGK